MTPGQADPAAMAPPGEQAPAPARGPGDGPDGPTSGPLSGIRVIELGQVIAGPFCGQLLGDLGAEVIKVEPPRTGDVLRQWGTRSTTGDSLWWQVTGRNKRSVTVDLRQAEGQALARRLVERADILIENFRPGTLERWGLGWNDLSVTNPGLIMVRVSGFGQDGPYARRAGYASIGEAMGGLRALTGFPDGPPIRVGLSIGDSLTGMMGAIGALAALESRHRTGLGQVVDAAIYESVLAVTESLVAEWNATGVNRQRTGATLPGIAPSNVYPTLDGQVLIAANQDSVFLRLTEAMGRPELAKDVRFADHRSRGEHMSELDGLIGSWTGGQRSEAVLGLLHENGVPVGLVYQPSDMVDDPHFRARESLVRVASPQHGDVLMQAVVPRLSRTPGEVRWAGPALGEHTDAVLRELVGLTDEEIAALHQDGVV